MKIKNEIVCEYTTLAFAICFVIVELVILFHVGAELINKINGA